MSQIDLKVYQSDKVANIYMYTQSKYFFVTGASRQSITSLQV